jgi:hypothetical protein
MLLGVCVLALGCRSRDASTAIDAARESASGEEEVASTRESAQASGASSSDQPAVPALSSTPFGPPLPPKGVLFPHWLTRGSLELAASSDIDLDDLARVAESTRSKLREWLGIEPKAVDDALEIYVCKDDDAVAEVERLHAPSASAQAYPRLKLRSYYRREARLIVIPESKDRAANRWSVSHEIAHSVFGELVTQPVEFVNEGLAELIPYWILFTDAESPSAVTSRFATYQHECGRLAFDRELPSLERSLRMGAWEFVTEPNAFQHYALAWSFTKLLVEDDSAQSASRYRELLRALGRGDDAWTAFQHMYDAVEIERRWHAELEHWFPWDAASGTWSVDRDGYVSLRRAETGASCLLSRSQARIGGPFGVSYLAIDEPNTSRDVGLVLAHRGPNQFIAARILDGGARVAISEAIEPSAGSSSAWNDRVVEDLPRGLVFKDKWVTLRCEESGRVRFQVDGVTLVETEIGASVWLGRFGWMVDEHEARGTQAPPIVMFRSPVAHY